MAEKKTPGEQLQCILENIIVNMPYSAKKIAKETGVSFKTIKYQINNMRNITKDIQGDDIVFWRVELPYRMKYWKPYEPLKDPKTAALYKRLEEDGYKKHSVYKPVPSL